MFKPPSISQSDIIMEFFITTSDDIIVLSPILTLGPIRADLSILQFLPIIDGVITLLPDSMLVDLSIIHVCLQICSNTCLFAFKISSGVPVSFQ